MYRLIALCLLLSGPVHAACGMPGSSLTDLLFAKKTFQFISGNMQPNFKPNDCLVIDRRSQAGFQRGAVIAFKHPISGIFYISRLLGLPGGQIEIRAGQVFLNGAAIPRERREDFQQVMQPEGRNNIWPRCPVHADPGQTCQIARYTEHWPDGLRFDVLDLGPDETADDAGPFIVPNDFGFVMGDNRDNSFDSRFQQSAGGVGFLPLANILGSEWKMPAP